MATTSPAGVILWDLRSGKPVARPVRSSSYDPLGESSLSPDGRTLAIAEPDQGVEILDVATLRRRAWLSHSKSVDVIRFTPDGHYVVGGGSSGWARLWSTKTGRPVSQVLAGHVGPVTGLAVDPDGDTLAVGGADGTIRLYDLPTQQPLGAPLPGVPNSPVVPEFTPDGAYLFAITTPGAPTAGTCALHRGRATPASWPGEPSREPNGRPRYPAATMRPPAPPDRHRARPDRAAGQAPGQGRGRRDSPRSIPVHGAAAAPCVEAAPPPKGHSNRPGRSSGSTDEQSWVLKRR